MSNMRYHYIPSSFLYVDQNYNAHKRDSYDTNASSYDLDLHVENINFIVTHTHTQYRHIVCMHI